MKKTLWILLSVILVVGIVACVVFDAEHKSAEPDSIESTPSWEQKVADQQYAVVASDALMHYFRNNGYITDYPDYYGGCYIADNVLHIRLCSPTEETMKTLKTVLSVYSPVVVYEFCEYSLSASQKYADTVAKEMLDLEYSVTSWGIDQETGNVEIGVLAEDMERAQDFLKNREEEGYPPIVIEEGYYMRLD